MDHYLIPRKPALGFTALLAALAAAHITGIVPAGSLSGALPVFCPFERLTGIPCPGCGMTRAILSIISGNPSDALLYNPFSFFLIGIVIASALPRPWLEKLPASVKTLLPSFYSALLVLVAGFWILDRLLPALT